MAGSQRRDNRRRGRAGVLELPELRLHARDLWVGPVTQRDAARVSARFNAPGMWMGAE